MYRWRIKIEAWPHSTGNGQSNDQKAVGDRIRDFEVRGNDMKEAYELAKCIAMGIQSHPMVWQAPITQIVCLGE